MSAGKQVIIAPLITLTSLTGPQENEPTKQSPKPITGTDLAGLSALYRQAYAGRSPQPGPGATAERIIDLFEGSHGFIIPEASLLATDPDGHPTAAIITVTRVLGHDGAHPAAVIAELFTHPDHRRHGLADELLTRAMHALHSMGHPTLAVAVDSTNAAAMAFYLARDFSRHHTA